ncbi:hypothetical protein [Thioalkalivibrio sp. ALE16]|uniref:hypothetical protein n=1 Tax=Thioalkalivibrio sp. ALE16 TaxID=1158172 RepID=UPI0012DD4595|nr:hypothetical protein [Thioalkalivibrio sp. ALE16]
MTATLLFLPSLGFGDPNMHKMACELLGGGGSCYTPRPFQPSEQAMAYADKVVEIGVKSTDFEMYGNKQSVVLHHGVPYAKYWQNDNPNEYVFHPMVFGRWIYNQNVPEAISNALSKVSVDLPNGGVAFYYPNRYALNRMSGPHLMYSAISQSEILAGLLNQFKKTPTKQLDEALLKVLKGLMLPHDIGGVNLGVAQLELPLFQSNPEIILNGWLHSLLHLNDYALVRADQDVAEYIHDNLVFFADNSDVWYDNKRKISRYSDTSPHRVVLDHVSDNAEYGVFYKAKDSRLSNYQVFPVRDYERVLSGFDVRILRQAGRRSTMGLTCSGLFDVYVYSRGEFTLKIRDDGYDPYRATPDGTGEWRELKSHALDGDLSAVKVSLSDYDDSELICGYPTNFAKQDGKNHYHTQHIMALIYLARTSSYDDPELDRRLIRIAKSWLHNNDIFLRKNDLVFASPQDLLNALNRGKVLKQFQNAEDILH